MANILIVDDNADNRELLRLMLEGMGHRVREAEDGHAGLQLAQAEVPELILLDLSMPKLDGWGLLNELRADERTASVPCGAVTAFADGERKRALEHGFDAYLIKPYRRSELMATIEGLLAQRTDQTKSDR